VVWIYDLKTCNGRKLALTGITFANDVTAKGNVLYVSDNRADRFYSVTPADFLDAKIEPKVDLVFTGNSVYPNGLYPAKDGSLLMVGFKSDKEARASRTSPHSGPGVGLGTRPAPAIGPGPAIGA
jgi:hypothetical protein